MCPNCADHFKFEPCQRPTNNAKFSSHPSNITIHSKVQTITDSRLSEEFLKSENPKEELPNQTDQIKQTDIINEDLIDFTETLNIFKESKKRTQKYNKQQSTHQNHYTTDLEPAKEIFNHYYASSQKYSDSPECKVNTNKNSFNIYDENKSNKKSSAALRSIQSRLRFNKFITLARETDSTHDFILTQKSFPNQLIASLLTLLQIFWLSRIFNCWKILSQIDSPKNDKNTHSTENNISNPTLRSFRHPVTPTMKRTAFHLSKNKTLRKKLIKNPPKHRIYKSKVLHTRYREKFYTNPTVRPWTLNYNLRKTPKRSAISSIVQPNHNKFPWEFILSNSTPSAHQNLKAYQSINFQPEI